MREFGQLVRERREALGLSAMDVAYSVGRAPSWVFRMESGDATHPPEPSIVVSDAGVCVRYRPPFDALLAGGVVPVPRWGRGFR